MVGFVLIIRLNLLNIEVEVNLRPTVSRPVHRGVWLPSRDGDQSFFLYDDCSFLMWGTLFDDRIGFEFTCTIAFGPRQSNHSRIEVP
jgi:hypothetical protein